MIYKEWLQEYIISLESNIILFEQRSVRLQADYEVILTYSSEASKAKLMEIYDSNIKRQETAITHMRLLYERAIRQLEKIEKRGI